MTRMLLKDNQVKILQNNELEQNIGIIQISCGTNFCLALTQDFLVFSWGDNSYGNLGLGHLESSHLPQLVRFLDNDNIKIQHISCGQYHSAATSKTGQVFTWGLGNFGQLGKGNLANFNQPDLVRGDLEGKNILATVCGGYHNVCFTNEGYTYSWGCLEVDQQNIKSSNIPYPMMLNSEFIKEENNPFNMIITYIAAGADYCMAIEQKRIIYAWGRNKEGQLGIGGISNFVDQPSKVQGLDGNLMKSIACGEEHSLFLTESGRIFACGSSKDGKLGLGIRNTILMTPQEINIKAKVVKIACGSTHSMALAINKEVEQNQDEYEYLEAKETKVIYTWGNGWESKLGHGDKDNLDTPQKFLGKL
ncbi:hypothetical protein IMG5_135970 [Ichthyophthirius multifiliis]|uniref:RCC1-like domain-containing protein n=1 Tax=Ichthyophthirius multifiliis TaxID=5932 RepID=G0QWX1_ICHMU|nr:hypothetical protein IMG5_135970 [Ichthyophthirius multifiliis]EGR30283.1 hypothetical protein IMG5_135970 [Ichthyophthirius multifiliis]|eukprot:XP_004031870.1 hypothetical protein IMG5_135970 [Ichthyophthirius multifiliis]